MERIASEHVLLLSGPSLLRKLSGRSGGTEMPMKNIHLDRFHSIQVAFEHLELRPIDRIAVMDSEPASHARTPE